MSTGLPIDWRGQGPVWLIFSALLLLPVGRMVELPTLIMAVAGGVLLWRHGVKLYDDPGQRLLATLFLLIWLPMLASLPDALNPGHSFKDAALFPRFYLAGVFVVWAMQLPARQSLLLRLAAIMLAFWLFDAVIQAVRGVDLFGHIYVPQRLNAVYGEHHLDFGVALPTLAPLLLFTLRQRPLWLVMAAIVTGIVVLMAGSRGGWMSYALVCLVLGVDFLRRHRPAPWSIATLLVLAATMTAALTLHHPDAQRRFVHTLELFSGDFERMDAATSYRLTLWQTAGRMVADHPINGVGVGSFRYAYPQYAEPGDYFVSEGSDIGAFYAHQIVVQVMSETGVIGLLGLVAFYVVWWRSWQQASSTQREAMLPFGLAALAWLFPFNTHASFYSAQWGQLIWLLLALYCAALGRREQERA